MRSPFQVYNFKRHVDSSSMHKESMMKMNYVKVDGKKKHDILVKQANECMHRREHKCTPFDIYISESARVCVSDAKR